MELIQLRYFVSIAETLSYTVAAERLHVSQPALSYQMRQLQREIGTTLFERKGRRIALTPDGELFLPMAQSVLLRADEAVRVLRENLGIEAGEVRMGCNPSVATYLAPGLIAEFRRNYPRVRVDLSEGGDSDLQQMVQRGIIDFAVVTAPGAPKTLDVTPLGAEDLLIILPPDHHLAGHDALGLSDLALEDWVLPNDSYNLTLLVAAACRRKGFELKLAYRTGTIEAVKNFVRQGLGVSILPSISLRGPSAQGLRVIAVDGGLTRDLHLVRGKDRSMTRAARALTEVTITTIVANMRQSSIAAGLVPEERE